jgi:hypothetical protein
VGLGSTQGALTIVCEGTIVAGLGRATGATELGWLSRHGAGGKGEHWVASFTATLK